MTAPLAWRLSREAWVKEDADLNGVLVGTARLQLGFGALLAAGFVL